MPYATFETPAQEDVAIPPGAHSYGMLESVQNPTGGAYASITDMSAFLRVVLSKFNGVTSSLNWLNPASFATGTETTYGLPWEIFRTTEKSIAFPGGVGLHLADEAWTATYGEPFGVTDGKKKKKPVVIPDAPVTFVTKSGGLPGYTSMIITIPELELGLTILVAGNMSTFATLQSHAASLLAVAGERAAAGLYKHSPAGRYIGFSRTIDPPARRAQGRDGAPTTSEEKHLNTTLAIEVDPARGVVITEFISNGTDARAKFLEDERGSALVLTPTLLLANPGHEGDIWLAVVTGEPDSKKRNKFGGWSPSRGAWDAFCPTDVDSTFYGGEVINQLVNWGGALEMPAFDVFFWRDDDEGDAQGKREGVQKPMRVSDEL